MSDPKTAKKPFLLPIMLIVAICMVLGMLRLGVWQLGRADEKQAILDQVLERAAAPALTPAALLRNTPMQRWVGDLRFQAVTVQGQYLADQSILIDNQVLNKQGGYQLITPMQISDAEQIIMISRGWLAAGATRQDLPDFDTPNGLVTITGRLNLPPAQPPLWKEGFDVNEGTVWQYLPIDQYAMQINASVLPLVVELAPENAGSEGLKVHWQTINDTWVAKHKGYAFQWFAMAVAFFVVCLVLLVRNLSNKSPNAA